MENSKKIYITGISGTGKSTIARQLKDYSFKVVSIEDIPSLCAWRSKKTKKFIDYGGKLDEKFIKEHEWICNVDKLKELMGESGVIVLGLVSNQDEFLHLFDEVILLQCPQDVFIKRIQQRDDNDFGKDVTAQKVILGWYKKFEQEMLNMGAVSVNTDTSIENVIKNVLIQVKK